MTQGKNESGYAWIHTRNRNSWGWLL